MFTTVHQLLRLYTYCNNNCPANLGTFPFQLGACA